MKQYWDKFTDSFGNTIFHPQFIVLGFTRQAIVEAKKYTNSKKTLVDIGCGRMPYKSELEPLVNQYTSVDHPQISKLYKPHQKPDVFADISENLPFKNDTFDIALMLQVLEYLENPHQAIKEVARILKPNGVLIITSPFFYPLHDIPFDKIRLTDTFLRHIIETSGLRVVKIIAQGNFAAFWFQSLQVFLFKRIKDILKQKKHITSIIQLFFLIPITPIVVISTNTIYSLFSHLTQAPPHPNYFPLNYLVIAKK